MQTATKGNTTWTYTYNADGLRTGKTNGTKAFKTVLNGLRSIFKPKLGTQLGRWGTLIKNTKPVIKGLTKHGLQRMAQRGVSEALAQKIINTGYAVSQSGGKVLYFTNEGVVVLNAAIQSLF